MVGDPNHLERMGRELKCPICLSLLNSAVSLNCNHVFCNSCIVKSMKSGSNCPVCKVPYRRREVRPAPHMDNLVGIYKSMEISSGVNIFVTQNAPPTKLSDGKEHVEGCNINDRRDSGQIFVEKQDSFRELGSREKCNSNLKSSSSFQEKPSFPAKKRVQVPHSQSEGDLGATVDKLSEKSIKILKKHPLTDEKGGPRLLPFFWLRDEENMENLSQETDTNAFIDMPLPNAPTFSDIKDSDDENTPRLTPEGKELGKSSSGADMFDSEMFEWTQRACSPELCSSPFKMQVSDTDEFDVAEGKAVPEGNVISMNIRQDDRYTVELPDISPRGAINANDQTGVKKSKKRGREAKVGITCPLKSANPVPGTNVDSNEKSQDMFKTRKRSKKVHAPCGRAEASDEGNKDMTIELPASFGKKKRCNEDLALKKDGKNCNEIHVQNQTQHAVSTKEQRSDTMQNDSEEVSKRKNSTQKDTIAQLSALFVPLVNTDKASDTRAKPSRPSRKSKSTNVRLRSRGKSKISCSVNSKDEIGGDIQAGPVNDIHAKEVQTTRHIQSNLDVGSLDDPPIVKKLPSLTNNMVLQRCGNTPSKIQCAFCLSSEDTEASGEMVHYYKGKPVAADYNGQSKVIHSHKNCTEWAPNVYFEEDVAMNLEAELARSRRIKCSCCGLKGAALGCYDKSCRKSFHIPCAKLTPQCRWDTENFLMLCPLHSSSKLPNECSESQPRKRKCNLKRSPSVQENSVAVKHDLVTSPNWSSRGSFRKLVLCCSALTNSEQEIVSEFERISGVTVSKKWESNVTHVIASTDESGACKRTLKVLMGILDGKWILSMKWINACMEATKLVDEECFEITVDTHGIRDGPRLGRLRVQNKQSKLFDGFKFYFMGEFLPSYKGYLQDLITAAGGTVLHRKPVSGYGKGLPSGSTTTETFVIYSLELSDQSDPTKRILIVNRKRSDAEALASSSGAKVVSNSWVLNSIAASKLQSLAE
ncbi:Protein BREAST CANCER SUSCEPTIBILITY 1-like protein [Morus notabilis]|uniref:Protein BREAST CANCER SUSCEPTIBILITY 1-like protein n=1 Tax=Morus notabilis TaxID=981085 RepID=W9QRX1_9ROSA|nr:protein BREAST CANCER SUSCEPTIBILITY 1 homolog [Morus notabilis]EXB51997.1 Protein BREAST CANCER SUSCEPTIBILITY 1-like protein [Morus notabilis]